MSYTQDDLTRLRKAMAKGASAVELNGEKVTFRSLDEMIRLERRIMSALGTSKPRLRIHNPTTKTGFR